MIIKSPRTQNHQTGFTLVEIAIVLLIVLLLLGGLVPTLSSQMEQKNMNETRKQLNDIQQALIGFVVINGRLPCPADGTIASGQPNAGVEKAACGTGANGGVIPWVTLGVSETDAWGRRFTYRVTPDFADSIAAATYAGCTPSPTPTQASFGLCSAGNQDVGQTTTATDKALAANVPAVIVSHGINGSGAYLPTGTKLADGSADEIDNSDNTNNHFVSHDQMQNSFDDLVVWVSPNVLLNRMVTAGKLP